MLISERILPLPKVIRVALIELFCPEGIREKQLHETTNNACLVRIYLGKNNERRKSSRPQQFFSLRNFKLHLNQMKQLGLDIDTFACTIANALAIMHWQAKVDAADVEFVLGSAPSTTHQIAPTYDQLKDMAPGSSTYTLGGGLTFHKRVVHLWFLDFDRCQIITMDENGLEAAILAFVTNDRYLWLSIRRRVERFWSGLVLKNYQIDSSRW